MASKQSSEPPYYHDILKYVNSNHLPNCRCQAKATDFQKHVPTEQQSNSQILLLGEICLGEEKNSNEQKRIIKNHFILLAQKFHPDKNTQDNTPMCTEIMKLVNKAYIELMKDISEKELYPELVVADNKIFQKINNCTASCQHLESFSIYGYPDHVSSWIAKLKDIWGSSPIRLKGASSPGRQFGDKTQSIFITIYDNGTIHVQGIMALQYSTEVIQPLLKTWFKPNTEAVSTKRFSNQLKKALGHFKEVNFAEKTSSHPKAISETTQRQGENTLSHLPEKDKNKSVENSESHQATQNNEKIATLENTITIYENLFKEMNQKLNKALKRIDNLESEVAEIKEENKHLQMLTGPAIGNLTRKIDTIEEGMKTQENWADIAKRYPQNPNTTNQPPSPPKNRPMFKKPSNKLEFNPNKCVVIEDIEDQNQVKKDDNIRRIVGRAKDVVIDRITHTRTGNIMVQLSDQHMVDRVIDSWDHTNFGRSKTRKTVQPNRNCGVLKGVPLDIQETEIEKELEDQGFSNVTAKRFKKNNQDTRAVKVTFDSQRDLHQAIEKRVLIQHLTFRVEEMAYTPTVVQCFNCRRFNHVASRCNREKICHLCSDLYDETHDSCNKIRRCINCTGNHSALYKGCPKYNEIYHKLNQRSSIHDVNISQNE